MKKRNALILVAITIIVFGLFLISLSFVIDKENVNDEKEPNDNVEVNPEEPVDDVKISLTYDEVYSMGLNLYGGENIKIEVNEEDDRFVIKRIFSETGAFQIFYVDKENGSIYTEEFTMDSLPTG